MAGTQKRNFDKHLTQILDKWDGIAVTLRHFTNILDERGQLISTTTTDTTITGVISSLPEKSELRGAGWINETNMVGFFHSTILDEHDHIIWDSNTFEVIKIHGLLYDIDEAVAQTVELARISA